MVDIFKANRQFERFLFLTPHDTQIDDAEDELIATIIFHFDTKQVEIIREDEKLINKSQDNK